jgi:hypothetical protein
MDHEYNLLGDMRQLKLRKKKGKELNRHFCINQRLLSEKFILLSASEVSTETKMEVYFRSLNTEEFVIFSCELI